jgi:hypothetical protein
MQSVHNVEPTIENFKAELKILIDRKEAIMQKNYNNGTFRDIMNFGDAGDRRVFESERKMLEMNIKELQTIAKVLDKFFS